MNYKTLMLLMLLAVVTVILGCAFVYSSQGQIEIDNGNSVVKIIGDIYIPKDGIIEGDVVAVVGDVKLDGKVKGDVVAVVGDVELNNVVEGDVVAPLGKIHKGPYGKVLGEVLDINNLRLNILPPRHFNLRITHNWGIKFFNLIILFGAGALVLAFMPENIKTMTFELKKDPFRKLLIGFLTMILVPVVILLTAISIIGLPLIPFVILALVISKFIGYTSVAFYTGSRIKEQSSLNTNTLLELFLGMIVLWLISFIPFIGFLSYLIVTMLALGLVIETKFGTNRPWFNRKTDRPGLQSSNGEENNKDDITGENIEKNKQ